jgi:hypothetical protein
MKRWKRWQPGRIICNILIINSSLNNQVGQKNLSLIYLFTTFKQVYILVR